MLYIHFKLIRVYSVYFTVLAEEVFYISFCITLRHFQRDPSIGPTKVYPIQEHKGLNKQHVGK
jgi:hypothetical protein